MNIQVSNIVNKFLAIKKYLAIRINKHLCNNMYQ